jgi:predicted alpha/beta hydrolase family esterase
MRTCATPYRRAPDTPASWLAGPSVCPRPPRLLIIPGLHNSGPAHWQTWLQEQHRHSVRVEQDDWQQPDLEAWARRIASTLKAAGPGPWLAVAHSFGCLALARHVLRQTHGDDAYLAQVPTLRAALLVAPAEPQKFNVAHLLPQQPWPLHTTVVASQTDPWMTAQSAHLWAQRWGSGYIDLGDAGHINTEAGFGPLPLARRWAVAMAQKLVREGRSAEPQR